MIEAKLFQPTRTRLALAASSVIAMLLLSVVGCYALDAHTTEVEASVMGTFRTDQLIVDTLATIGSDSTKGVSVGTIKGHMVVTSTSTTNTGWLVEKQSVASTNSNNAALRGEDSSTFDTTGGPANAIGTKGQCSATRSAGGGNLICNGLYGEVTGTAQDNRAVRGIATGNTASVDNYAMVAANTASGAGATNYGIHASSTGGGGTAYAAFLQASGASGSSWGLYVFDGMSAMGVTGDPTFVYSDADWGDAEADKINIYGKPYTRGAEPSIAGCGVGQDLEGNDKAGVIHFGTGTPTDCVVTFNQAWVTNPPICVATLHQAAPGVYVSAVSTTSVTFTLTVGTDDVDLSYICTGRLP